MTTQRCLILVILGIVLTGVCAAAEEPRFAVVLKVGAFEVRDYPALTAADVTIAGNRRAAANAGFRVLARYIFGANSRHQSLPMTAPVIESRVEDAAFASAGAWRIRFIMPPGYTPESLPAPEDPRVHLAAVPPMRFAVVRFSGLGHDPDVARSTADLKSFIESHHLKAAGPASIAGYNPPWTPWFMRRNEILMPLVVETGR